MDPPEEDPDSLAAASNLALALLEQDTGLLLIRGILCKLQ